MLWYFLHMFSLLTLQDDALLSKVGIRVLTSLSTNSEISCRCVTNNAASFWRALAATGEGSLKLSSAKTDSTAFCRISTRTKKHTDINACQHNVFYSTLQKMIGCFNHWVVTLVADKLRRQWLWDVYLVLEANCISNQTIPYNWQPSNICETTTTLQKYDAFVVTLTDVQWLLQ